MKSDGQTLLEIWRNTSSHVRGIIANGEVTVSFQIVQILHLLSCVQFGVIVQASTSPPISP